MNNKTLNYDIVVLGGGASGVTASIFAKRKNKNLNVLILENKKRICKKLLLTGNGRCNITNKEISVNNFHGSNINFIDNVLSSFSLNDTLDFFSSIGLILKPDNQGRFFPYSNSASTVVDCLLIEIEKLGIEIITDFNSSVVSRHKDDFVILNDTTKIYTKKLILACGGLSYTSFSNGKPFLKLLKELKIKINPMIPSLVQVKSNSNYLTSLMGLRAIAKATLFCNGNSIKSETGEVQFKNDGLSGICIFNLSRYISSNPNGDNFIALDLMPEYKNSEILELIKKRKSYVFNLPLENLLSGILNKRIGLCILKSCGVLPLSRNCETLSNAELNLIVNEIKNWKFKATGTYSFNSAQITAGGIDLNQINNETMEFKKNKNLFACGEMLDVDGDCGGYNLQWAWSSGAIAGTNAAT